MKTVVNTSEVAHLWANQSQEHARNAGDTVYFSGDTIYSYGGHFPMARHVDGVVLVSTRGYSVTTSGHQSATAQACHHLKCFHVDNVTAQGKAAHKDNLAIMRNGYEALILTAARARKYGQSYLNQAESLRLSANEYSAHFKLRIRIKPADVAAIAKRGALQAKKAKAAERKRERIQAEKFAELSIKWRKGENVRLPYLYNQPAIMRLIKEGEVVETSQGARFPADHARLAIPLVRHCQSKAKAWEQNGERIRLGSYRLDRISDNGDVKAGCHRVLFAEVQHIAALLAV
jgi:hypothetical protein